jgi:transglutaminase-like putative cysteine protease
MRMLYAVTHTTKYRYTDSVSLCHNLVHLRPRVVPGQTCHHSQLLVRPEPRAIRQYHDYFGNPIALFTIQEPHRDLAITATHDIEVTAKEAVRREDSIGWEAAREAMTTERTPALLEAVAFTFASKYVPRTAVLAAYAAPSFTPNRCLLDAVTDLTERIHKEFRYDAKATTLATPLGEVLQQRRGVCQDFAHLAIGCLRSLGLAARYVSGYLQTRGPAGRERLIGADASHAWFSVYCPGIGWVDFDPTNNIIPSEQHITVAWGRDYEDISPIKGVILGGGSHTMSIAVDVAAVPV